VIFFCNRCVHSQDALNRIKKIGEDNFIFVNIEEDKSIPEFIDRVPAILTSEKKVLVDDALFDFLSKLTIDDDTAPYMVNEMSGLSDKYSFMDDSKSIFDRNFEFIDKPFTIITSGNEDNKKILNYEEALAKRDNDLKN
jgi:hypothetical protein